MRALRGAPADGEGTFASFVFERMRAGGARAVASMLDDTPDEFTAELTEVLRADPALAW